MHKERIARVIPIILRPVSWERNPLARLKVLPTDGKPIISWGNKKDEAFVDVTKGLRKAALDIWLDYGNTHYKEENFPIALYAYTQFMGHSNLEDDYSEITMYTHIGHCLYATHKYTRALKAYELAIKL